MSSHNESHANARIAVLIPAFNEATAIETVVRDFSEALPAATVYVYDNNSTDDTSHLAKLAGAVVRVETLQGKGNVVRRMFADIEAEVYVLVDGDGTYDAQSAKQMVEHLLNNSLDMVNGARTAVAAGAFRPGHRLGNRLLTGSVALIFGSRFNDMLSGYRVLSRRFVKSFPALSSGFETETELTVHALELRAPIAEIQTPYRNRLGSSQSKLRTYHDGFRILRTILLLIEEERPLHFFSFISTLLLIFAFILGWPLVTEFLETGLVPRIPTAILVTGIIILSFVCFAAGLLLNTITLSRREMKRLHYLGLQGPTFRERRRGQAHKDGRSADTSQHIPG